MPLPSRRPVPPRRPSRHTQTSTRSSIYDNPFTARGTGSTTPLPGPKPPATKPIISPTVGGALGVGKKPDLPPDSTWDAETGTIKKDTLNTVSALKGERDRGLLDYGYNVQYDQDPNSPTFGEPLTNTLSFDPTNVFSRAAQLRKRWMEARSGTRNGMAAQGQMNSGAYGRAQRQNNYGESQQTDAEMKGLIEFLARNGTQIAGAKIAGETALGEAMGARVSRVPTNPLYNPTPGGPGGPGVRAAAPAAKPKPKVKAKPKKKGK